MTFLVDNVQSHEAVHNFVNTSIDFSKNVFHALVNRIDTLKETKKVKVLFKSSLMESNELIAKLQQ
jgi:hypothetical protein